MSISTHSTNAKKYSIFSKVGVFSASLLAASSAVYLYSPVIGSHADSSTTADINLAVGEVMSLTLNANSLDLSTNPNSFISGVITATASTNSQYGYTLALEDVDSSSDMTHTNTEITSKLTSDFSGKKTSTEMDNNTWGFSLNTTDFYKVPVNGSAVAIKRTTTPMTTASESTDVTFGAKVGNLTSGTYTDKVLFTMYVNGQDGKPTNPSDPSNPPINPSDPGISDACAGAPYVSNNTLTDPRDGNTYAVKTLADGNCWMTENLKISNVTISDEDSNLPENTTWTIPASSMSGFGDYDVESNSVYIDSTNGGFYTFLAATAGWGIIANEGNSPQDICPKGWRLPTASSDGYLNNSNDGELYDLKNHYDSVSAMREDAHITFSGQIFQGSLDGVGSYSILWSSTAGRGYLSANAYALSISDRYADNSADYKSSGNQIRCIVK